MIPWTALSDFIMSEHVVCDASDTVEVDSYPPRSFEWVVDGVLAIMSHPRNPEHLRWIQEQGIKHLVTLSPEKRPPLESLPTGLQWSEIAIDEFDAPTTKQIIEFIDICQRCQLANEALGVHCRQGRGRSGVMAACYLMRFQDLPPERAVADVRHKRPGAIETEEQEQAVLHFYDCIKTKDSKTKD